MKERSSQQFLPSPLARKTLVQKKKSPNQFRNLFAPNLNHECKFLTQVLQLALIVGLRLSKAIVNTLSLFCQFIKHPDGVNLQGNYNPKCWQGYVYSCCLSMQFKCIRVVICLPFVMTWTQFLGFKYKFRVRVRVRDGKIGDLMGHLIPVLRERVHNFFLFSFHHFVSLGWFSLSWCFHLACCFWVFVHKFGFSI